MMFFLLYCISSYFHVGFIEDTKLVVVYVVRVIKIIVNQGVVHSA